MSAPSHRSKLGQEIRSAVGHYRRERLARYILIPGWIFCGLLLLWLVSACISPSAFAQIKMAVIFAGSVALLSMAIIYGMKVDERKVRSKMDAAANWPDSVQSAASWPEGEVSEWHRLQQEQTAELLQSRAWKKGWALRWPPLAWVPGAGSVVIIVLLFLGQANWQKAQSKMASLSESTDLQVQKTMLEDVFKDWDQAQKEQPDPELEALLKEVQPLREKLAEGKISEKELFLEMNKIEDRLEAMQAKTEEKSMEPMAADLAAALEPVDGMSGLASALKKKDFEGAMAQAAKMEEKLQKNEAKMPSGEKAENASKQMGALSKKAEQNQQGQLSQSLQQMQQGLKEGNSEKMCQGMAGLKQCLGGQCNSQGQKRSLSLQMAQMNACKNGNGQGTGIGMGPPKLSLTKSKTPGKGAGTEVDSNRFGSETQLDAGRNQVNLTGAAGEGESEVQTESSQVPVLEERASGVTAKQFAAYEKMSKQAADDENLPVAYRETIKRYFENIRPKQGP